MVQKESNQEKIFEETSLIFYAMFISKVWYVDWYEGASKTKHQGGLWVYV